MVWSSGSDRELVMTVPDSSPNRLDGYGGDVCDWVYSVDVQFPERVGRTTSVTVVVVVVLNHKVTQHDGDEYGNTCGVVTGLRVLGCVFGPDDDGDDRRLFR